MGPAHLDAIARGSAGSLAMHKTSQEAPKIGPKRVIVEANLHPTEPSLGLRYFEPSLMKTRPQLFSLLVFAAFSVAAQPAWSRSAGDLSDHSRASLTIAVSVLPRFDAELSQRGRLLEVRSNVEQLPYHLSFDDGLVSSSSKKPDDGARATDSRARRMHDLELLPRSGNLVILIVPD